jgi:hypothetical protein
MQARDALDLARRRTLLGEQQAHSTVASLIIKQIGFLVVRHGIFQKSLSISENSTRSPVLSKNESFSRILHKNPCVFLKSTRSPDLSHTRTVILYFSKPPLIF